jgi:hypothetical protein
LETRRAELLEETEKKRQESKEIVQLMQDAYIKKVQSERQAQGKNMKLIYMF